MIIEVILLFCVGLTSFLYTSYVIPSVSNIIPVDIHYMFLSFSCIILLIDNFSLMNDIQNFKPFDNPEHIHIIGDQAIELQKSKIIIYNLTKIKEHQIKPINEKKLLKRFFSSTF
jgi:hypothetical protein